MSGSWAVAGTVHTTVEPRHGVIVALRDHRNALAADAGSTIRLRQATWVICSQYLLVGGRKRPLDCCCASNGRSPAPATDADRDLRWSPGGSPISRTSTRAPRLWWHRGTACRSEPSWYDTRCSQLQYAGDVAGVANRQSMLGAVPSIDDLERVFWPSMRTELIANRQEVRGHLAPVQAVVEKLPNRHV